MSRSSFSRPISVSYRTLFSVGYLWYLMSKGLSPKRLVKPATKQYTVLWILRAIRDRLRTLGIEDRVVNKTIDKYIQSTTKRYKMAQRLTESDVKRIREDFNGLFGHFVNDTLRDLQFFIRPSGHLVNPRLLDKGVRDLLGLDTYDQLEYGIVMDLRDAIDCIRMGLWTPAVMITLRAIEGSVRQYYELKLGEKPIGEDGKFLSWRTILDQLHSSGKLKGTLSGYLDFLRERRNEAEHPGKRFSQELSERTLVLATEALKAMNE